ncbi:DNA sulfur modification protein DndB [Cytobacillus gottheilii]|uniref:DNA sulfur modification protein DndB n=1 Tax=Cytobacillus gottheilii TaxID=859144 RepID=UPI0009BBACC3|nr:DNA sulfur modification protein DndB [Cytobacillus gottheilii]
MGINLVFSKKQTFLIYSFAELIQLLKANAIQLRDVNQSQVRIIKKYIIDNAATGHIYLPPFVANIEEPLTEHHQPNQFAIVDGTQRMIALQQLEEMIMKSKHSEDPKEIKKGYSLQYLLQQTSFAIQMFERLTKEEADQLYIDLNTKGKTVALSKIIAYDSRNQVNQITNKILQSNTDLQIAGVEIEKRAVIRPTNKKFVSLSQLRQIVQVFLNGQPLPRREESKIPLPLSQEDYINLVNTFLAELFKIYSPTQIGDYRQCMLASFPVLLSIAKYVNEGQIEENVEQRKLMIKERIQSLEQVDWKPSNLEWKQFEGKNLGREQLFYIANNKVNLDKLIHWLKEVRTM